MFLDMVAQTEGLSKPGHCTVGTITVDSGNACHHDLPSPVADQPRNSLPTSLVDGNA
jgi:hypothetical protein